ncbi:MAG: Mur ligase domain-containing protein, partial [Pseudomonadota bacterium]
MFRTYKKIHMVGIGGIGMSGIAQVLMTLGYEVSGSDLKESEMITHLKKLGAKVYKGHHADNIKDADLVIISSAVQRENPEMLKAKELGIPVIPRAEMLSELMRLKYGIAVAGTHGKTSTTAIIAWVLEKAGLDPTAIIGGKVISFKSNAKLGEGEFMVAEADESDRSFLKLTPSIG